MKYSENDAVLKLHAYDKLSTAHTEWQAQTLLDSVSRNRRKLTGANRRIAYRCEWPEHLGLHAQSVIGKKDAKKRLLYKALWRILKRKSNKSFFADHQGTKVSTDHTTTECWRNDYHLSGNTFPPNGFLHKLNNHKGNTMNEAYYFSKTC